MLTYYHDQSANKAGIYEIRNRHTNRSYIGQTNCFKKRVLHHKSSLLGNSGNNSYFRNDFNKCYATLGRTDFLEFHVIEVMENSTREERNRREDFWIKKARQEHGKTRVYNFISNNGVESYSRTPEETLKRLQARPKRYGKKNPMYGKVGLSNPMGKFYDVQLHAPDGTVYGPIEGLHLFCRTHGLSATKLCAVINGRQKHHLGWRLQEQAYRPNLTCLTGDAEYGHPEKSLRLIELP